MSSVPLLGPEAVESSPTAAAAPTDAWEFAYVHPVQPSVRVRSLAGGVAPPLFVAVLVALTMAERGFLHRVGWSPVHRTKVEWPSLLALGYFGSLMIATFVVTGICGAALASAMWS